MNYEVSFVVPESGKVIEIYRRKGGFDFLVGFCRGLLFTGSHVSFVEGFRRGSDPGMTSQWAEPHHHETGIAARFIYGFVQEKEWMTRVRPTGGRA